MAPHAAPQDPPTQHVLLSSSGGTVPAMPVEAARRGNERMAMVNRSIVDVPAAEPDPVLVGGTYRTGTAKFGFSHNDRGETRLAFALHESVSAEGHRIQQPWPTLVFSYPEFLGLREHKLNPPGSLTR